MPVASGQGIGQDSPQGLGVHVLMNVHRGMSLYPDSPPSLFSPAWKGHRVAQTDLPLDKCHTSGNDSLGSPVGKVLNLFPPLDAINTLALEQLEDCE